MSSGVDNLVSSSAGARGGKLPAAPLRACYLYLLFGILGTAGYLLLPWENYRSGIYLLLGATAVVAIVAGVRTHRPRRPLPWWLLASGCTLFVAGDVAWSFYESVLGIVSPFPSVADALYLASYPCIIAGLIITIRHRAPGREWAGLTDALILATGLGMLSWSFLIDPYAGHRALSLAERLISISYPFLDVVVLALLARLLMVPGGRPPAFWLLSGSLVFMLVADTVYVARILAGTYTSGEPTSAVWLLSYVAFASAALHPSMSALPEPVPHKEPKLTLRRVTVLAVAGLAAPSTLALEWAFGNHIHVPVLLTGSMVLFLLMVVRGVGMVREQERTEAALRSRDAVLQAVSFAARRFIRMPDWEQSVCEVLERLGKAAGADRVYICENRTDGNGAVLVSQRYEWLAPEVRSRIGPREIRDLSLKAIGFGNWEETLSSGMIIDGHVQDFPDVQRELLGWHAVKSIVVAPIFVDGEWWGFLGFHQCLEERRWSAMEVDALKAAAGMIGSAIHNHRMRHRLYRSEQQYRSVVESVKEVIFQTDTASLWTFLNPAWTEITGFSVEESIGASFFDHVHPDDRQRARETFRPLVEGGKDHCRQEVRYLTRHGGIRWFAIDAWSLADEAGNLVGTSGTLVDVTDRKRAEEALRESERRFRSLVQNASDIISVLEADGTVRYQSPAIERVLGYAPDELVGENVFSYLHPGDLEVTSRTFNEALENKRTTRRVEFRFRHKDGSWRWLEAVGNDLLTESGIRGVVVNSRDITDRKTLEDQLVHQAFHDPLTGLPNRRLFVDRLQHALTRSTRTEGAVAVLFMDLDNFKVVNDSLGHEAGDRLLRVVARRLKACLRPEDTVARFGGDEFVILLENIAPPRSAAEVARRVMSELQLPFIVNGQEIFVSASIGIALSGSPEGDRADLLIRDADAAMYWVKREGKAHHAMFDPRMSAGNLRRLRLEGDLRRALEREEFKLYYQPKVDAETGRMVAVEALLRWEHPTQGLVLPSTFVPLAEETGLIEAIGKWVLNEACLQGREWQERCTEGPPLVIAVNLSARQFHDPYLAWEVERILRATGFDPCCLELEITESVLMSDAGSAVETLAKLKELGVRLSVDDFGTGYSSLAYLKLFPVDCLKIDRSFVDGFGENSEDEVIASGIIDLAHALGLEAVAEGVETTEQLQRLRDMGCDLAQGFYLSEPLPAEAVAGFLERSYVANVLRPL